VIDAFVVDTNVVVAGLITGDQASPVARILDGMLAADWPFALSEPLIAEYDRVLHRPALMRLHGLPSAAIESLLTDLVQRGIVIQPARGPAAPDPGDQMLWDLLACRADLRLVTGDRALLAAPDMAGRVISPARFVMIRGL
jgi:predicted nucleic acid-binding protein